MMTALHYACENGHLGVVGLLNHKADINAAGSDRRTPLIYAAAMGRVQVTQALLKRKTSTRQVDDASMTALHWAAFNGHAEIVGLLGQKKESLAVTNIMGRSALHLAVLNSKFAVVELLLTQTSINGNAVSIRFCSASLCWYG
jgi:ankyrin repeat protein